MSEISIQSPEPYDKTVQDTVQRVEDHTVRSVFKYVPIIGWLYWFIQHCYLTPQLEQLNNLMKNQPIDRSLRKKAVLLLSEHGFSAYDAEAQKQKEIHKISDKISEQYRAKLRRDRAKKSTPAPSLFSQDDTDLCIDQCFGNNKVALQKNYAKILQQSFTQDWGSEELKKRLSIYLELCFDDRYMDLFTEKKHQVYHSMELEWTQWFQPQELKKLNQLVCDIEQKITNHEKYNVKRMAIRLLQNSAECGNNTEATQVANRIVQEATMIDYYHHKYTHYDRVATLFNICFGLSSVDDFETNLQVIKAHSDLPGDLFQEKYQNWKKFCPGSNPEIFLKYAYLVDQQKSPALQWEMFKYASQLVQPLGTVLPFCLQYIQAIPKYRSLNLEQWAKVLKSYPQQDAHSLVKLPSKAKQALNDLRRVYGAVKKDASLFTRAQEQGVSEEFILRALEAQENLDQVFDGFDPQHLEQDLQNTNKQIILGERLNAWPQFVSSDENTFQFLQVPHLQQQMIKRQDQYIQKAASLLEDVIKGYVTETANLHYIQDLGKELQHSIRIKGPNTHETEQFRKDGHRYKEILIRDSQDETQFPGQWTTRENAKPFLLNRLKSLALTGQTLDVPLFTFLQEAVCQNMEKLLTDCWFENRLKHDFQNSQIQSLLACTWKKEHIAVVRQNDGAIRIQHTYTLRVLNPHKTPHSQEQYRGVFSLELRKIDAEWSFSTPTWSPLQEQTD